MNKRITIIGLGLVGGSLAKLIRKRKLPVRLTGTSGHASTVRKALRRRMIHEGTMDLRKAVSGSDLVFICTPIRKIIPTLRKIALNLKPGAVITDVGSTKAQIVKEAEKIMPAGTYFVGGHPMAGTEHTGIDSSFAELFDGRPWILTVTRKTNRRALSGLEKFLKKLKIKVIKLSPEEQDVLVAGISHLPLAVSSSLVSTVAGERDKNKFAKVASSGFRDTTRIASGAPILGADLFTTNRKAVLKMIGLFKRSLGRLEAKIRKGKSYAILRYLDNAKKFRDGIFPG